jgi:hypothetical protein
VDTIRKLVTARAEIGGGSGGDDELEGYEAWLSANRPGGGPGSPSGS